MNIAQVCMGEESPGMLRNPAGKKVNVRTVKGIEIGNR